jgi:hypothetical protein
MPARGLDLERSLLAAGLVGQDVVAGTIAFDFRNPENLAGEVAPANVLEPLALEVQHEGLALPPQHPVAGVAPNGIELPDEVPHGLGPGRGVATAWRRGLDQDAADVPYMSGSGRRCVEGLGILDKAKLLPHSFDQAS